MQPDFRLVDEDHGGAELLGLQEKCSECHETERAVGERTGVEVGVGALVPPFQTDFVLVELEWRELEIVEERGDLLDGFADPGISVRMSLAEKVEECRQIGSISPKIAVVVHIPDPFHRRALARVVEVVEPTAIQPFARSGAFNLPSHTATGDEEIVLCRGFEPNFVVPTGLFEGQDDLDGIRLLASEMKQSIGTAATSHVLREAPIDQRLSNEKTWMKSDLPDPFAPIRTLTFRSSTLTSRRLRKPRTVS